MNNLTKALTATGIILTLGINTPSAEAFGFGGIVNTVQQGVRVIDQIDRNNQRVEMAEQENEARRVRALEQSNEDKIQAEVERRLAEIESQRQQQQQQRPRTSSNTTANNGEATKDGITQILRGTGILGQNETLGSSYARVECEKRGYHLANESAYRNCIEQQTRVMGLMGF
jgi:hypothetical protein